MYMSIYIYPKPFPAFTNPNSVTFTGHLNLTQNTGDPHQRPPHSEDSENCVG